jgi:3-vinyl bacteriochlorophyllide hydratase
MDQASPVGPAKRSPQADTESKNRYALYTAEERKRRDETVWTLVQGILAPLQFLVFIVSLVLVIRTLKTGEGAFAADASVVVKNLLSLHDHGDGRDLGEGRVRQNISSPRRSSGKTLSRWA